jgi:cell division protein FtsZ
LAFVAVGMGGGTGTGGSPLICKLCQQLGILTIAIVTIPALYEGNKRLAQAMEGIRDLQGIVDTLIIVDNEKLKQKFGNLKMREVFAKADTVLGMAVKCVVDIINSKGEINVDFADVCTVVRNGGHGILGHGIAIGENRAEKAIQSAFELPLLTYDNVVGAKWILVNVTSAEGSSEYTMEEIEIIQNYIISKTGEQTDCILGIGHDKDLGEKLSVTFIITGFNYADENVEKDSQQAKLKKPEIIQPFPESDQSKSEPLPKGKKIRLPSGLSKRITQAVLMPAFILLMQSFFKLLFDVKNIGFGISLASVSLAQLFPYLFYDNLILLKVYKLNAAFDESEGSLVTKHYFSIQKSAKQITRLKTWTLILFLIVLSLFIITLGLAYKKEFYDYHTITGFFCVLLSILYLIFV